MDIFKFCQQKISHYVSGVIFLGTLRLAIPMADHSGYKIHLFISYSLAYLKYLNKYALTANVSIYHVAYVKYVNTFACQNYLHKIVVLCISVFGRWE